MKLPQRRRAAPGVWLPALLACAAGCALNHPNLYVVADAAPRDAADADATDARADAATDATADVTDATADVAVDVAADAPVDAPADVALDAPLDAPPDVAADVPIDAAADVPLDVAADAPVDAADVVDVAPDLACPTGYERCGGMCVDLSGDRNNCGRCGSACTAPETCIAGSCGCGINQRVCAGACVSVLSDSANCGACGNACALPETCFAGTCSCSSGRIVCGTGCVDTQAENGHCGRCDNACGEGACAAGVCGCGAGRTWCAGRCVDTATDPMHCGACGNACARGGACAASACMTTLTCAAGTASCNGNDADGCEVDTASSVQHCGGCGRACASSQRCAGGACAAARSCAEVHRLWPALPTGQYDILPDGAATARVWCDMDTAGGGWTVVYLWPAGFANVNTTSLNYDVDVAPLRMASTEALMAYRNASRQVTDANWARFPIPTDWVTQSPFRYDTRDVMVMASLGTAAPVMKTLRYGYRQFGDDCGSGWAAGNWGRVCLNATSAPFFNGFSAGFMDECPNGNHRWNNALCTDTRRFSIAVR